MEWVRKDANIEGFHVDRSLDRHHHADFAEKSPSVPGRKVPGRKTKKKTLVRKYVSIIVLFARYAPGRRKLDKFRSFSVGYHFKAIHIKPDVAVPEVGGRYPASRYSCLDSKNTLIEN